MKNFKLLRIWQMGMEIANESYMLIRGFPSSEKYGLASQLTKSAVSIPSNIAEGCAKSSAKDTAKFIEIALGSSFELETQLMIAQQMSFGEQLLLSHLLRKVALEQQMLFAFRKKVLECG